MNKDAIICLLCLVVATVGAVVIYGWIADITALKSVLPHAITMKFSTALSFICSAIITYLILLHSQGYPKLAFTFLPLPCLVIGLMMAVVLSAMLLNINTGIENLFFQDQPKHIITIYAGHPCPITILDFCLIFIVGIMTMLDMVDLKFYLQIIGAFIAFTGTLAVIGYIFDMHVLYYDIVTMGNAMAIHTAYLFVMVGTSLILLGCRGKNINEVKI